MEAIQPLSVVSTSLLHRLPPALFALVTQFLPLPEKLLQLAVVSHAFPPLTPVCFAFDTLVWTSRLITQLSRTPAPPLLSLLSQVPYALYVDADDESHSLLCGLLASSSTLSFFPGLRAVTIDTAGGYGHDDYVPPFPIAGLRHCSHLTGLDLHCPPADRRSDHLSSLPLLSALRTLRVSGRFTSNGFLLILSLPLTSLDLHSVDCDIDTPPPSPFPSLLQLQSLLLPSLHCTANELTAQASDLKAQWDRAIMSSLTTAQQGTELQLQRLQSGCIQPLTLSLHLPLLRRLHTLQLHLPESKGGLADFLEALIASPLPLRHLRLEVDMPTPNQPMEERSGCVLSLVPTLVSVHAGHLLALDLSLSAIDDAVLDPPQPLVPASVAEAFTAALLSCRSLRRLLVTDCWLSMTVPFPSAPAFPDLESLELCVEKAIDLAPHALLLDAAPHLQELTFKASPMPLGFVAWIGERCHELRTLILAVHDVLFDYDEQSLEVLDRPRPLPAAPALPYLTVLAVEEFAPLAEQTRPRFNSLVPFTQFLAHSAPSLRHLYLPFSLWDEQYLAPVSKLAELTRLQSLHLGPQSWWNDEREMTQYWQVNAQGSRVQRDGGGQVSVWGDGVFPIPALPWRDWQEQEVMRGGAMREVDALALLSSWGWTLSVFTEEVDGVVGREAFFAAIAPKPHRSDWVYSSASRGRRRREEMDEADDDGEEEEKGEKRSRL